MKVYYNKRNTFSISSNKGFTRSNFLNELFVKNKKNKENQIEEKINVIANYIKRKISEGKDIRKISLVEFSDIDTIIEFILSKNWRKVNDLILLRQFLMSFSNLYEISLNDKFNDKNDLINKITASLKKEEIPKNEILFLSGQLGKIFFIIIRGEVAVLIPIQFSVKLTCSQFYQYMEFLLDNKEYELMRLSFESNEKMLKQKNYQNPDEYEKFLGLLNTNLSSNASFDPTELDLYINKFTKYINEILEGKRRIKEKEEEEENEEEEDDSDSFNFFKEKKKKKKKNKKKEEEFVGDNKYIFIKYNFLLWKYHMICTLEKGKTFGEIAIKKSNHRRTATIITKADCIFGKLEKDDYQASLKEFMEKARKINTEALMNSKLFLIIVETYLIHIISIVLKQ